MMGAGTPPTNQQNSQMGSLPSAAEHSTDLYYGSAAGAVQHDAAAHHFQHD